MPNYFYTFFCRCLNSKIKEMKESLRQDYHKSVVWNFGEGLFSVLTPIMEDYSYLTLCVRKEKFQDIIQDPMIE